MPDITRITEYQNKELIKFLEECLELAKSGDINGMAYALRHTRTHHSFGLAGAYVYDPAVASNVISHLQKAVDKHAEEIGVIQYTHHQHY
jgi:uncharacterized membrane protein YjfL (UPF0719 family)